MANPEDYVKLTTQERQYRYFSESFKKKKVSEIERGLCSVAEVSRTYQVTGAAVYKWLYKYSMARKKGERLIVESKSDTVKIDHLKAQLQEMERIIGQKQIQLDFLEKIIEIASEQYGTDLKKKFTTKPSSASGKSGKSTDVA